MIFVDYAAEDFFVRQVTDPKKYFVYFEGLLCRIMEEDSLWIDKGHQAFAKIKNRTSGPDVQYYRILIFRFAAGFGTLNKSGCRVSSGRSLHHS